MTYVQEDDGTKRYEKEVAYILEEEYFFGCEFEFYVNEDFNINPFVEELFNISDADLLVNEFSIPHCTDSNDCMHLKKDVSLEDNGFEISTPKTSYTKLIVYIKEINLLIKKYGYTNSDTGFHIHISTSEKNGINFDFYKFALLSHNSDLLYIWESRNEYCRNVMDIISCNAKTESKNKKNKKGKVWNLEKIANNRIEIRTMGGDDYHLKTEQILEELIKYFEVFKKTLEKDTDEYKKLRMEHLETVNNSTREHISEFYKIFLK